MTKDRVKLIANFLLFQATWFVCVLSTESIALYFTCTVLFIHFIAIGSWHKEKEIIAICLLLGSTVDSFLGDLNILLFGSEGRIIPLWLACIWVIFGTTIRHSLAWAGRHLILGATVGFFGGPAAYYAGSRLTDVRLAEPLWQTLLILAITWAVIIPLLQTFSITWQKRLENQPQK